MLASITEEIKALAYIPASAFASSCETDRWQGRQEDLDGEGRSWRFLPPDDTAGNPMLWKPRWVLSNRIKCGTHRLPHFALPISEATDG